MKDVYLTTEDLIIENYVSLKNSILADVLFALSVKDENIDLMLESLNQIILKNFNSGKELQKFLEYYKIEGYENIIEMLSNTDLKPPLRSLYNIRKIILNNIENKKLFNEELQDFLEALDEGNQILSKKYFNRLNTVQKSIIDNEVLEWLQQ